MFLQRTDFCVFSHREGFRSKVNLLLFVCCVMLFQGQVGAMEMGGATEFAFLFSLYGLCIFEKQKKKHLT